MCVCVCISVVVFLLYQQSVRDHRNSASHTGDDDDDDVQRHSILNNDTFQEFFNARSKFPSHAETCVQLCQRLRGHGLKSHVVIRVKDFKKYIYINHKILGGKKKVDREMMRHYLKVFGADLSSCGKKRQQYKTQTEMRL